MPDRLCPDSANARNCELRRSTRSKHRSSCTATGSTTNTPWRTPSSGCRARRGHNFTRGMTALAVALVVLIARRTEVGPAKGIRHPGATVAIYSNRSRRGFPCAATCVAAAGVAPSAPSADAVPAPSASRATAPTAPPMIRNLNTALPSTITCASDFPAVGVIFAGYEARCIHLCAQVQTRTSTRTALFTSAGGRLGALLLRGG